MPFNFFHAKPDAFGGAPIHLEMDPVGRSGRTITTAGSTTYVIPTPYRKGYFRAASASCISLVGTSGSTAVTIQKVRNGTVNATLTGGLWAENMTAKVVSKFALSATATDADRTVLEGDLLQAQFVNTTGIDVQPVEFNVGVELLQLE